MPALYERVATEIERRIRVGELGPGQSVPPIGDLAKEFGVGVTTVKTAMLSLRTRGLIETVQGKGTYVARDALAQLRAEARAKLRGER
jgi:DNA-binding GntR family transcriptional regulator